MTNENLNTDGATDRGPSAAPQKPASEAKAQAARENGKMSHGPKTEEGKARSSQNAYKHGFFVLRLFTTREQWEKDGAEYQTIARVLIEHCEPVGHYENFLVEKIVTGYVRLARIIGHEQRVFGWNSAFETKSASSLPRYQSTIERQIAKDVEMLERLQAARKAETDSSADGEGDAQASGHEAAETEEAEVDGALHRDLLASPPPLPERADAEPKPADKSAETNPTAGDAKITATNPPKPRLSLVDAIDEQLFQLSMNVLPCGPL